MTSTTAPSKAGEQHEYTPEETALGEKIKADSGAINSDVDRMKYEAEILETISTFFIARMSDCAISTSPAKGEKPSEPPCELAIKKKTDSDFWYDIYNNMAERLNQAQIAVLRTEERAALFVGIFTSFILPILFGAIGAVAYVIRAISNQIKTSTFSQNSPVRHLMRVALGAMSGLVVGLFVGLSSQLSLPPLALSFLAGYGVEAVFSMFDGLVDKFRQGKPVDLSPENSS